MGKYELLAGTAPDDERYGYLALRPQLAEPEKALLSKLIKSDVKIPDYEYLTPPDAKSTEIEIRTQYRRYAVLVLRYKVHELLEEAGHDVSLIGTLVNARGTESLFVQLAAQEQAT